MNLLFVNPTFRKWGGVEEVVLLLAEHFLRCGHRVVVASEDTPATLAGRFPAAVVHYGVPLKRKNFSAVVGNLIRLAQIMRHEHIDLISSHQAKTTVLCRPVGRLLKLPVVHSTHTWRMDGRIRWLGLGRHVVANSETTRVQVARLLRIPPEAVSVIYDAPPPRPAPAAAAVEGVRAEFGLMPDTPTLVCLGRLTEDKGHEVLIRALPLIRSRFPSTRTIVVGKGHLRRHLETVAGMLGLTEAVTFAGYRTDAHAIVCAATVAVLPSLRDAFPLTNIECLRLGVPVVSTAVDGIPEVIRDGETGYLALPNDSEALATAVMKAIADPAAARRLAARGRAEVTARFHPDVMCQDYEACFTSVLRGRRHQVARSALEPGTGTPPM